MALPGVLLVRLRALCNIGKCVHSGCKTASDLSKEMRWYGTKSPSFQMNATSYFQSKRGEWRCRLANGWQLASSGAKNSRARHLKGYGLCLYFAVLLLLSHIWAPMYPLPTVTFYNFYYIYYLVDSRRHLLKEFPDPKSLLHNTISRSLGVSDLSQLIQYSCMEHAGVKVSAKVRARQHYCFHCTCDKIRWWC